MILQYLYYFPVFATTNRNTTQKKPPPSPPRLPIIGNLHQIGPYPHVSLRALAKKYGPLMLLKFGSVPVLVVSSADAAREILRTYDLVFSDRPISNVSNKIFYYGRNVGFSRYSEYWRQVKSICVTQLLSTKRVHSFHNAREEEVALFLQKIRGSHSKTVNLSEMISQLTNNILFRVVLGGKSDSPHKWNYSYRIVVKKILDMLAYSHSMGDFFPYLVWFDWLSGLNGKVEKAAYEVDAFLESVVRDHHAATDDGCANKDFVSILLDIGSPIDKECIKAVILDMLIAGTETTATTLEWTMAALIKNPDVMSKLQKEVRKIGKGKSQILEDDLVKMNYLKAVMKESMRLYMPAPLVVPREARQDVNVLGYDIEAGTQVLINAWALSRDPSLWDNPEEFRPERFLNSPVDYKGLHYEYLPFGSGRRGCPGIQFAVAINELAVANIVHNFNLELPDGKRVEHLDMTALSGLVLHLKSPLLVVATPHV
ncbi:hypothetical protein DCAR_0104368 [Daucus carota subsp. sativus]|uniref:Uncharacterized protein n=1 Tax=Daucus carota subsp. sativus TaxID=79200 RepID=A0A166IS97_DAUCS|nr:PREDICTED: psoralen synthase-like [Daucus carota subsp. sativus]WOG85180.1 hypothetical protein DCAR_0104368 [Daucus carota subsp. sativus]